MIIVIFSEKNEEYKTVIKPMVVYGIRVLDDENQEPEEIYHLRNRAPRRIFGLEMKEEFFE